MFPTAEPYVFHTGNVGFRCGKLMFSLGKRNKDKTVLQKSM